jgi:hypothetical protein
MLKSSVARILLLIAFFGCTAPAPRESIVLKVAVWGPLGELTPDSVAKESGLASIAQPWVYEKLVAADPSGELRPALASQMERGERVRVQLRHDATFSDGVPVTDSDVIRSLELGGLRVTPSGDTLVIEAREHGLPVDALLLQTHVFRESDGKFLGSGPFEVASRSETELKLTRRVPRPGRINEVRVIAYGSTKEAFSHTLKGEANLIVDLESRWLEFFQGVPSLQIVHGRGHSTDAVLFSSAFSREERVELAKALESPRVRELAYAQGECSEMGGPDPESLPPGRTLRTLSWGPFERLALAARRVLGDREAEVSHVPVQVAMTRVKQRDFDLATARPLMWPPSAMALIWRTGGPNNIVGYSNRAVDHAIDAGDWKAARAALREDPPAAFVCTRDHLSVIDARVKNPTLGPYDILETLPDWEVQ